MNIKRKTGFTLIELLTVVAIVALLIALLLPALSKVMTLAFDTRQRAQINSIEIAMEAYRNDFGMYPSSTNLDSDNVTYYGSEKLADALLGYDLLGVHSDIRPAFDKDGEDVAGTNLYNDGTGAINLDLRKGPYLEADKMNPVESASADDIFDLVDGGHYISDIYGRDGLKGGLPILYYKANTNNKIQNPASGLMSDKVYDYNDSDMLFANVSGEADIYTQGYTHIWGTDGNDAEEAFDKFVTNYDLSPVNDATAPQIPYRAQTFILISAGYDGLYGTADDVCNFENE